MIFVQILRDGRTNEQTDSLTDTFGPSDIFDQMNVKSAARKYPNSKQPNPILEISQWGFLIIWSLGLLPMES